MDKFPLMLYMLAATGELLQNLGRFATLVVHNEEELAQARENGWFETTEEAIAPPVKVAQDDNAPPTADELRERLRQLGQVTEDGMDVKALAQLVADAEAKAKAAAPAPAPAAPAPAPAPAPAAPAAKTAAKR